MQHKKIGIIGGGTMGAGIAQVAAQAGHEVIVVDRSDAVLQKAQGQLATLMNKKVEKQQLSIEQASNMQARIKWTEHMGLLQDVSLVIEAIVENLTVKQTLFGELEQIVSADCILASNTSSLSITSIASACSHPERVMESGRAHV